MRCPVCAFRVHRSLPHPSVAQGQTAPASDAAAGSSNGAAGSSTSTAAQAAAQAAREAAEARHQEMLERLSWVSQPDAAEVPVADWKYVTQNVVAAAAQQ